MSKQISIQNPDVLLSGTEDITQCVYLILSTIPGSDPLRPDFGSDLYKYLDKPLEENKPMMVYSIKEAVERWENRINVNRCEFVADSSGTLRITLHTELTASGQPAILTVNI